MTEQSDRSRELTDKACKGFEVAEAYDKGCEEARGMNRKEAAECNAEALVEEESQARVYLDNAPDPDIAEYVGEATVKKGNWSLFKDPED